jgi:hypothetical protein
MATVEEWNGFVGEEVADFIQKAVELYQNETLWTAKQQKGFDLLQKNYNKAQHITRFKAKMLELDRAIAEYRKNNFLLEVFKHHSAQSTKYMGLWIEEKNKHKKSE